MLQSECIVLCATFRARTREIVPDNPLYIYLRANKMFKLAVFWFDVRKM